MSNNSSGKFAEEVILPIIIFYVVISVIALFITLVMSSGPNYSDGVSAAKVSDKAFHLQSGRAYPFRYGKRIEGSSGYAEASAGLFSSYARVSLQPASALSVNFKHGRDSYILELPVSKIKFIQTTGKSSIRLRISHEVYKYLDEHGTKLHWMIVPYFEQETKPLEKNQWFKNLKETGQLGPLVQDYFQSATIKLSPQDYSKILGG